MVSEHLRLEIYSNKMGNIRIAQNCGEFGYPNSLIKFQRKERFQGVLMRLKTLKYT
jgi:hypothetical protein